MRRVYTLLLLLIGCTAPGVSEVIGDPTGRELLMDAPADRVFRVTVATLEEYGFSINVIDRRALKVRTRFRSSADPLSDGRAIRVVASVVPVEPDNARLQFLLIRPSPGGRLPQQTEPPGSGAYGEILDVIKAKVH